MPCLRRRGAEQFVLLLTAGAAAAPIIPAALPRPCQPPCNGSGETAPTGLQLNTQPIALIGPLNETKFPVQVVFEALTATMRIEHAER